MPLTLDERVETLNALHNIPRLLQAADPTTRRELYRELGLTLTYRRDVDGKFVQVSAQLGSVDLIVSEGHHAPHVHAQLGAKLGR